VAKEQVIDNTKQFEFIGYDKRFFAATIDAAIGVALSIVVMSIIKPYAGLIYSQFLVNLLLAISWLLLIVKYGGTPGKLLLRIRIVNKQGTFISLSFALLRLLLIFLVIINSLLKYYHAFAGLPLSEKPQTLHAIRTYGGVYNTIGTFLFVLFLIDVGIILLRNNKKNRAIHDFIAGSYVITKESYLRQDGCPSEKPQVTDNP